MDVVGGSGTDTLGCVPKIQEICVTAYEVSGSCPAGQVQVGLVFWITLKSELARHILKERRDAAYARGLSQYVSQLGNAGLQAVSDY